MQQLLFGPCYRKISKEKHAKIKSRIRQHNEDEKINSYDQEDINEETGEDLEENNSGQKVEVLPAERTFKVENTFVNLNIFIITSFIARKKTWTKYNFKKEKYDN